MKHRVLVVDDELHIRHYLSRRLALEPDLEVVDAVASAYAACACLRKQEVDLVLLDYEMDGADGMQLVTSISLWLGDEVSAERKRPHALFCTGHASPAFESEARAMGARGVVSKGHCEKELLPAIRTVLQGGLWFGHGALWPAPRDQQPRILVADTSRPSRAALSRVLEENGYLPTLAWSYSDLLALLSRDCFQALILDTRLPYGSTPDALDQVARGWPDLPVLLIGTPPPGLEGYQPIPNVVGTLPRLAPEQSVLQALRAALEGRRSGVPV